MPRILLLLYLFAGAAGAQERDVQRALLLRQQQSDAFQLQLQQSQQRLQLTPGDLNQQQILDRAQLEQRQALENLGARQQSSLGGSTGVGAQDRLIQDRQSADIERRIELQRPFVLQLSLPKMREPVTPRP